MTYLGHVQDGIIVLDGQPNLPEGATVQVVLVAPVSTQPVDGSPSLYERLAPVIGSAKHLPTDASQNVDEYLYGYREP